MNKWHIGLRSHLRRYGLITRNSYCSEYAHVSSVVEYIRYVGWVRQCEFFVDKCSCLRKRQGKPLICTRRMVEYLNCMHKHNEHTPDQCNEKRNNSTTSSTASNSAFHVTCSTQWQYDRCIDQNTSTARTIVGRRSSPKEGPMIYSSLCSTTPVCGRTSDRTYSPHCFMPLDHMEQGAAIKNTQPCKSSCGDYAYIGTTQRSAAKPPPGNFS